MATRMLAAALLLVPALGASPPCAEVGVGYSAPSEEQLINTADAMACQDSCKQRDTCAFFTWYPDTQGCWLQGSNSVKNMTFPGVVSGPERCPGDVTVVEGDVSGKTGSGKTGTVVQTLNNSTGASFPWWAWVLIGLGIAACGLCILSFICCSTRKKSSKRSQKVSAKKDLEAGTAPESAPLVTSAPPVGSGVYAGSPVYTSGVAYQYPTAAPGTYAQAAPVATGPQAAPITSVPSGAAPVGSGVYSGSPVYTSGVAYQYPTAAPVTYAQAAPVATGPQDLFTQLDANGDGVLSPQELAQMQAMRPAVPAMPAGYTYASQ